MPLSSHIRWYFRHDRRSAFAPPFPRMLRFVASRPSDRGVGSARVRGMFGEFLSWWCAQLAELLPRRLRRSPPTAADATVITPLGGIGHPVDAVEIGLRRNGKEGALGRFPLAASGLAEIPHSPAKPAVLRLGETDVLGKTVVLPLAAERELGQVLEFEMDRETPFTTDELYWNHRVEAVDRQNSKLSVRLLMVPKAALAPLLEFTGSGRACAGASRDCRRHGCRPLAAAEWQRACGGRWCRPIFATASGMLRGSRACRGAHAVCAPDDRDGEISTAHL